MKNYVITGSIGHISKPIVQALVKAGKNVSVITSNAGRAKDIEALGARAVVGSLQDAAFLQDAFRNADVVYTMIPPIYQTTDWRASQYEVGANYTSAIRHNNIRHVVNLSSIGAHLGNGCGPVDGLYDFEQLLNQVAGLNVLHLRPSSFYYNLLNQVGLVKAAGILGNNYGGGDQKIALVHTNDIARVATDALLKADFTGSSVRYIVSDKRTGSEIAAVLGAAIGKEIPWVQFTDEQELQGLVQAGLPAVIAEALTQMGGAIRNGKMQEHVLSQPLVANATTLEEFSKEFKAAFLVG